MLGAYAPQVRRSASGLEELEEEEFEADFEGEQGSASAIADPGVVPNRARDQESFNQRALPSSSGTIETADRQASRVAGCFARLGSAAEPHRKGDVLHASSVA